MCMWQCISNVFDIQVSEFWTIQICTVCTCIYFMAYNINFVLHLYLLKLNSCKRYWQFERTVPFPIPTIWIFLILGFYFFFSSFEYQTWLNHCLHLLNSNLSIYSLQRLQYTTYYSYRIHFIIIIIMHSKNMCIFFLANRYVTNANVTDKKS